MKDSPPASSGCSSSIAVDCPKPGFDTPEVEHFSEKLRMSKKNTTGRDMTEASDAKNVDHAMCMDTVKTPWASIAVAAFTVFVCVVQFSIYFSSLWPYMHQIDKDATQTFYGFTLAAFSFGQMLSSPLFGYWNNRLKLARPVVAVAICFSIAGNIVYMFAGTFPTNQRWVMVGSRLLGGIGGGVTGTLRGYLATGTAPKDKARAIAIGTMALSLGITAGPALQACVTGIGYPGFSVGPFHVSQYTAPAYICTFAALILLVLLVLVFKENSIGVDTKKEIDPFHYIPKYDKGAALLCILCWFSLFFSITNGETVESPYTMAVFNWSNDDAVYNNSIIMAVSSSISFCIFTGFAIWGQRLKERVSITIGLCLLCGFYVATFSWPFYTGSLHQTGTTPAPTTTYSNMTTTTVDPSELPGCHSEWCNYTPALPLPVYLSCYPFFSVGLPFSQVSISTLFSKIIGPRRQGFMQSLMIMAGSAARMLGPILISWLFDNYGPRVAWSMTASVVSISIFSVMILYRRLVPLQMRPKMKGGDMLRYDGGMLYRF